jgi:hypothetical protein
MVSDSAAVRPALTRDEAGALFGQTMGLVAVTAVLFACSSCCHRSWAGSAVSEGRRTRIVELGVEGR